MVEPLSLKYLQTEQPMQNHRMSKLVSQTDVFAPPESGKEAMRQLSL